MKDEGRLPARGPHADVPKPGTMFCREQEPAGRKHRVEMIETVPEIPAAMSGNDPVKDAVCRVCHL